MQIFNVYSPSLTKNLKIKSTLIDNNKKCRLTKTFTKTLKRFLSEIRRNKS